MKDNFSSQSVNYERYRPDYPVELYKYIFSHVKSFDHAWDCATGNGQVAKYLTRNFKQVEASDISHKQLDHAYNHIKINYHVCPAESTPFRNDQFDLVTVAQALHWFDFKKFFPEVKRVLKPSGILAVWTYGLLKINEEIGPIVSDFYKNTVGPYWDDERKHVENQYLDIEFPFNYALKKAFFMYKNWSLDDFTGYLNTWSSVKKYKKDQGHDPVTPLKSKISELWPGDDCKVTFPIYLHLLGDEPVEALSKDCD